MQALQNCIRRITSTGYKSPSVLTFCGEINNLNPFTIPIGQKLLHTTPGNRKKSFTEPRKWPTYNDTIFPPQTLEEERRPAYVCHVKTNIKYSYKKMWYISCLVRGMSVDEAVRQLSFVPRKGAVVAKETILEAQQLAVNEHNVEFKSNLWVAESFVGKAFVVKGVRRHAKSRMGRVEYKYVHYFVRLEEGPPPKEYYWKPDMTGPGMLDRWLTMMRNRTIAGSL